MGQKVVVFKFHSVPKQRGNDLGIQFEIHVLQHKSYQTVVFTRPITTLTLRSFRNSIKIFVLVTLFAIHPNVIMFGAS